jgi:membrane protease YdiL (CAAX protease family)
MKIKSTINWKTFGKLLAAGIFGTICVFPYILTLQAEQLALLPISIPLALALSLIQTTVLLSLSIFIGLLLGKKVGLKVDFNKISFKKTASLSIKLGILAGILIIASDLILMQFMEPIVVNTPPIWQGLLASFYGAIVEEILIRLFLMTLVLWMLSKFTRQAAWPAIIIASLVFGLGHLPATAQLVELSPLIIFRALFLNGIGGVIFGWLYWKKGLSSSMTAHFSTDIVLHVLFPLILLLVQLL